MPPAGLPDYWPWMVAYHHVREPLYRAIIRDLQLPSAARILDAGSGDCFYSRLLAQLLGPDSQIVAVDLKPNLLRAGGDLPGNVQRCLSDLDRGLGLARASFDVVWLCRSMFSATEPMARLAALLPMLAPSGRLVVVENDTAHHPILPFPAEFEHRLRRAQILYERSRCHSDAACARYKAASHLSRWLAVLGLDNIGMHTYVSEDLAPFSPEVETYWREFLAWDAAHLAPFLSPADAAYYRTACDPGSPTYLFSQPGCYCLELTTVAVAQVHSGARVVPATTEFTERASEG